MPTHLDGAAGRRQRNKGHSAAAIVLDASVIALAAAAAVAGRNSVPVLHLDSALSSLALWLTPWLAIGWLLALLAVGAYDGEVLNAGTQEHSRVLTASWGLAGLVGIGCYLTQFELSRGYFLLFFGLGAPMLVVGRMILRRVVHEGHRRGRWGTSVVLVGTDPHIDDVAAVLARESWLGYRVTDTLAPLHVPIPKQGADSIDRRDPRSTPAVPDINGLIDTLRNTQADAVVFTEGAFASSAEFRRMAWELEEADVQLIVVPAVTDVAPERLAVRRVAGLPLVYIDSPRAAAAGRKLKRAFDIVGALVAITVTFPLMAYAAMASKRYDGGPVIFRQERVGRDGDVFECLKFRTMVVDAERRLADLKHLDIGNGVLFKMNADPRVTPPGRWMRRFSVDELPQLFNVLRGEMSLIGPRPQMPSEVLTYRDDEHRRLRVRPGITGLWQVSGRADLSWADTIRLDLYYVDNWSMVQDLQIVGRTLRAVVRGEGAY